MAKKTKRRPRKIEEERWPMEPEQRLRPMDVPQAIIDQLTSSLGIEEWEAADLVVFSYDELCKASTK